MTGLEEFNDRMVQMEDDMRFVKAELDDISTTLAFIKDTMIRADSTIAKVAEQVMPTLDELMKSPMLRMLTGGKKK